MICVDSNGFCVGGMYISFFSTFIDQWFNLFVGMLLCPIPTLENLDRISLVDLYKYRER